MKKPSTTKTSASPAPAIAKAVKSAPATPAPKKPAAAKSAPAPTPTEAPLKAAKAVKSAAPAAKAPAPAVKPPAVPVDPVNPPAPAAAPAAPFTVVTAQIDVGFGNTLYLRGEGPGLSWNKGLALNNARADQWTISLPRAARPIVFKFLLNDETWSDGEDYKADPGASVLLSPTFSQTIG